MLAPFWRRRQFRDDELIRQRANALEWNGRGGRGSKERGGGAPKNGAQKAANNSNNNGHARSHDHSNDVRRLVHLSKCQRRVTMHNTPIKFKLLERCFRRTMQRYSVQRLRCTYPNEEALIGLPKHDKIYKNAVHLWRTRFASPPNCPEPEPSVRSFTYLLRAEEISFEL